MICILYFQLEQNTDNCFSFLLFFRFFLKTFFLQYLQTLPPTKEEAEEEPATVVQASAAKKAAVEAEEDKSTEATIHEEVSYVVWSYLLF